MKISLEELEALARSAILKYGYSEEEALKLIGYVVASEVFSVFREDRRYDENKYIAALKALPKLPWEKEG